MDHPRSGSGGGLPPQLDPGFLEQMSRAQSSGQFFPGDLRLQPQPSNLREHEYAVGGSQLNMPPLGPAYMPPPTNLAHAYAPMDHARTEQQLAELFSSQLDLFGPPLGHPLYRHVPAEEQFLGDGCSGPQDGEEKPRSKMQEKNRRAQRRFRERQKTKFVELNTRVEELEGVISELLSEKTKLEDRTSFLEKALESRSSSCETDVSSVIPATSQDAADRQGCSTPSAQLPASASAGSLALPEGMTLEDIAEGSIRFFNDDLCLSIPFKGDHFMSIEAIKSLTPRDVIHLYECYVEQLRRCLQLEASDQPSASASVGVVKLANEIGTLLLRRWALNPVLMRQLFQQLNSNDRVQQDVYSRIVATMRMPAEQRRNFVAVNKSFQARRQVLLDQRQAIYARLQRQSTRYNNAEDTIAEFLKAHDAMNTLKTNLRQEHWETLSWGSTCHQLLTPWQLATLLVEAHPHWYDLLALSSALEARELEEASRGPSAAPGTPL